MEIGLALNQRRVYFHRSRIFVNGSKIPSSTSLDEELAPGDPVTVDVVFIQSPEDDRVGLPPFVFSQTAFWVALSVQMNTRDRGARIAKRLREEVVVTRESSPKLINNCHAYYYEIRAVIGNCKSHSITICQMFNPMDKDTNVPPIFLHFSESA
jgi:hypothetical protein